MRAASLAAAVAVLALTGCGGSGGSKAPPQHHIHLTAFETRGKAIFIADCGMCHQLADAGTSGTAGPALAGSWAAPLVRETIANGIGAMPANLVTGRKAAAVAAYVAAATR